MNERISCYTLMRRDLNECTSGFICAHHFLFYAKLELDKIIKQIIIIYMLDCNLEIKPLHKACLLRSVKILWKVLGTACQWKEEMIVIF